MDREHARAAARIISHGPCCLDGIVSAVVVARSHEPHYVDVTFSNHAEIDDMLLGLSTGPDQPPEVWITDISWTSGEVNRHLCRLALDGTRIFWIDHHRTAIERHAMNAFDLPFAGLILNDTHSAARLVHDFVRREKARDTLETGRLTDLKRLVDMADDHDRWIHQIPGSHGLAQAVGEMDSYEAYEDLLGIDAKVTYTRRMHAAVARVQAARAHSFDLAAGSRVTAHATGKRPHVVAALCDGYASEIGAAWGGTASNTIFAFFDLRTSSVSLRRSPDCELDLSHFARRFGGGGHPVAAGCRLPAWLDRRPANIARHLAAAIY